MCLLLIVVYGGIRLSSRHFQYIFCECLCKGWYTLLHQVVCRYLFGWALSSWTDCHFVMTFLSSCWCALLLSFCIVWKKLFFQAGACYIIKVYCLVTEVCIWSFQQVFWNVIMAQDQICPLWSCCPSISSWTMAGHAEVGSRINTLAWINQQGVDDSARKVFLECLQMIFCCCSSLLSFFYQCEIVFV